MMNDSLMSSLGSSSYGGQILSRTNSISSYNDEMVEEDDPLSSSAITIQLWVRGIFQYAAFRKRLTQDATSLETILQTIRDVKAYKTFEETKMKLECKEVRQAVKALLFALPTTSKYALGHLQDKLAKNKVAFCVQMITSAFMIAVHPEDLRASLNKEVQNSLPAKLCYISSKLLLHTVTRLLTCTLATVSSSSSSTSSSSSDTSIATFKSNLQWYRFALRFFFESMDQAKTLDAAAMVKELCMSYEQLQHVSRQITFSSSSSGATASNEAVEQSRIATEQNMANIRNMLSMMKGPKKANAMLSEIEQSVAEMYEAAPATQTYSEPTSPKATQQQQLDNTTDMTMSCGSNDSLNETEDQLHSDLDHMTLDSSTSLPSDIQEAKMRRTQQLAMLEKRLEMVSAGGESERLAHEICLNPSYKLPDSPSTAFIDTLLAQGFLICPDGLVRLKQSTMPEDIVGQQPQNRETIMANNMKRLVLDVMADRMICALRPSTISKFEDVTIGSQIAVTLPEQPTALVFMTAIIDTIDTNDQKLSISYLCTKKKEINVSFDRIKRSHHGVDLSQFFAAFGDLHTKISSFSQKHQMEAVDYELLVQMMKNQSISAHQLATILVNHLNFPLERLMAPARAHRLESWIQSFLSLSATFTTFDEILPFLPFFFEVTSAFVEELQRDMVNFYISTLAPTLYRNGHELLALKFEQRLKGINDVLQVMQSNISGTAGGAITSQSMTDIFQTFLPHTLKRLLKVMDGMKPPQGSYYTDLQSIDVAVPQIQTQSAIVVGISDEEETQFQFSDSTLNVMMSCFLIDLLKMPVRLSMYPELPEVYCFDGQRLSEIRDDIDSIVLLACIGISIKQIVYSLKPLQLSNPIEAKEMEEALFYRLDTLLRQSGAKVLESLCVEATRYVENLAERRVRNALDGGGSTASLSDAWKNGLRKAIEANTVASSPIMTLFMKRAYELVLRGLLGVNNNSIEPTLQKYSMRTSQQASAVRGVIDKTKLLLGHHAKVHKNTYTCLLQLLIVSGASTSSTGHEDT